MGWRIPTGGWGMGIDRPVMFSQRVRAFIILNLLRLIYRYQGSPLVPCHEARCHTTSCSCIGRPYHDTLQPIPPSCLFIVLFIISWPILLTYEGDKDEDKDKKATYSGAPVVGIA